MCACVYVYRVSSRSCECGDDLGVSVDPEIVTAVKTRHSIVMSQPAAAGSVSRQDFEFLLRSVRFAHDPQRPLSVEQYSATVTVTASDGELMSEPAFTEIEVSVTNLPPSVLISSPASAVMSDGETSIPLFQPGTDISVFEDTTIIRNVSITLTNPRHSKEQLLIELAADTSSDISLSNSTRTNILLTGPASPSNFSQALTDARISFLYPPMESILQGDVPDFTPR